MAQARRRAILWPRFGRERQFPGHRMAVAGRSTILWTMTDAMCNRQTRLPFTECLPRATTLSLFTRPPFGADSGSLHLCQLNLSSPSRLSSKWRRVSPLPSLGTVLDSHPYKGIKTPAAGQVHNSPLRAAITHYCAKTIWVNVISLFVYDIILFYLCRK